MQVKYIVAIIITNPLLAHTVHIMENLQECKTYCLHFYEYENFLAELSVNGCHHLMWMFGLDHYHYARWLLVLPFVMLRRKVNPDIYREFEENGNFTVRKTDFCPWVLISATNNSMQISKVVVVKLALLRRREILTLDALCT